MPDKKKLKRANSYNGPNSYRGFEIIERPEPIGEQGRNSMHALHRPGSNEGNQRGNGNIRDQNGPAPNNNEPNNNPINNNIINENVGNENPPIPDPNQIGNVNPQQNGQYQINGFEAQRTERSKWSKWSQAGHVAARGAGAVFIPLTGTLGKGYDFVTGASRSAEAKAKSAITQKARNHNAVPGRRGESFKTNPNEGNDILTDFRRVPIVWSYLTAARAVDAIGHDIDPKITVYVKQPKTGSSRSMVGPDEMGHTMLGIEYTRDSKISGKKERYNIKFGFYPAGGMTCISTSAMMGKGAVVPGQLRDDAGHEYDISKTYSVSREKAVDIAEASEKYTERGGYGYYERNCTTFVRDMFRVGGIPEATINSIFTEEKVRFDASANSYVIGVNALGSFFDASNQRKMGTLMTSEDLSYQGWGNKRVTKKDFDIYKATKNAGRFRFIKALSPAAAGENMRRMTGEAGQLGSYRYAPDSMKDSPEQTAGQIYPRGITRYSLPGEAIRTAALALRGKIYELLTEEQKSQIANDKRNKVPFAVWLLSLGRVGERIRELGDEGNHFARRMTPEEARRTDIGSRVTSNILKGAYNATSKEMAEISRYYQTVLGSDSRINTEVMNLLSTMQITLEMLDESYRWKKIAGDELGDLREQMSGSLKRIIIGNVAVDMTPTHYESYLQIYETPKDAVEAYSRYLQLKAQRAEAGGDNPDNWNGKTVSEWERLSRTEALACNLDQSHRQMLEQSSFSQSDIDYVFRLRVKELKARVGESDPTGVMYTQNETASFTYMALFFDKIFGGIQSTAQKPEKDGGLPDLPEGVETNIRVLRSTLWLHGYLLEKFKLKEKGMKMILRGMVRSLNKPPATVPVIKKALHYFLLNAYLHNVFPVSERRGEKVEKFSFNLDVIYSTMEKSGNLAFPFLMENLIRQVIEEEKKASKWVVVDHRGTRGI